MIPEAEIVKQVLKYHTLGGFGLAFYPKYKRPEHVKLFEDIGEKMTFEKNQRYIIEIPPRHGKSVLFSILLPAFYIVNHPDRKVLIASYSYNLAGEFAFKVRTLLKNNMLANLIVEKIDNYETKEGGGLFSAGVGGSITGKGASLLILDDPFKNLEEAKSKHIRNKVFEWFNSTFFTRAEPDANIVIIQTRWHTEDLAGHLLSDSNEWNEIKLPAIAEDNDVLGRESGDALWPERFPIGKLGEIKKSIGSYIFSALYQQNPLSGEGSTFKREWFEIINQAPADITKIRYWDLAATEEQSGGDPDWTAGCLLGKKDGIFYICDMQHVRTTPLQVEKLLRQTAIMDGIGIKIYIEKEPGAGSKSLIDYFKRQVLEGFAAYEDDKRSSKEVRAVPLSAAAEAGNVKLIKGHWNKDFLDEIEIFPQGDHDDQVDAVSGAYEKLNFGDRDSEESYDVMKGASMYD